MRQKLTSLESEKAQLLDGLKAIAKWPGNLSDERYTSPTGPKDAALRGSMVVTMRELANYYIKLFDKK